MSSRILQMAFQPVFMSGHRLGKVDRSFWATVRNRVVPKERPTCAICGFVALEKRGLIHADEVWEFPEPPRIVLSNVRPLCVYCHEAKGYDHLLRLIGDGTCAAERAASVQEHYCRINNCTPAEFSEDFRAELTKKRRLEELYGPNALLEIDYGKWTPPRRPPKLTSEQRKKTRDLYEFWMWIKDERAADGEIMGWIEAKPDEEGAHRFLWKREEQIGEPISVREMELRTFGAAVKWLQSLPVDARDTAIKEMQEFVEYENDYDEDWLYTPGGSPYRAEDLL
jgi:hypothetical protein